MFGEARQGRPCVRTVFPVCMCQTWGTWATPLRRWPSARSVPPFLKKIYRSLFTHLLWRLTSLTNHARPAVCVKWLMQTEGQHGQQERAAFVIGSFGPQNSHLTHLLCFSTFVLLMMLFFFCFFFAFLLCLSVDCHTTPHIHTHKPQRLPSCCV